MRDVIGKLLSAAYTEKHLGSSRPKKATAAPTRSRASRTSCSARTSTRRITRIGNAPVNYPPVWNIWKFDWVQYNASVSQPMARNIGESMGTGAKYCAARSLRQSTAGRNSGFARRRYIENLHDDRGDTAQAAAAGLAGGRARSDRSDQGGARQGPVQRALPVVPRAASSRRRRSRRSTRRSRPPSDPEWIVKRLCIDDIGTDPNTALELREHQRRHGYHAHRPDGG